MQHLVESVRCLVPVFVAGNVPLDQRGSQFLGRQKFPDPFVYRADRHYVFYNAIVCLGYAVDAVLGLQIIVQAEGPVKEEGVIGYGQSQSLPWLRRGWRRVSGSSGLP